MLCSGTTDSRFRYGFLMISSFWHPRFMFSLGFIMNSAFWHNRFACSLRISNVFCVLTLKNRIIDEISKCFLLFKRVAGRQKSHYRCDSIMFSVIQAFGWPSKLNSLVCSNILCDSSKWLVLEICILDAIYNCVLCLGCWGAGVGWVVCVGVGVGVGVGRWGSVLLLTIDPWDVDGDQICTGRRRHTRFGLSPGPPYSSACYSANGALLAPARRFASRTSFARWLA